MLVNMDDGSDAFGFGFEPYVPLFSILAPDVTLTALDQETQKFQ
jgi:hypothetical protein